MKKKILLASLTSLYLLSNTFATNNFYKAPFIEQQVINNNWTFCANENEICNFKGEKKVMYVSVSHPDKYIIKDLTNWTTCSNSIFWDPDIGNKKKCFYINKNVDLTNITHRYIYNDKFFLLTDDKKNLIIKDFSWMTAAVLPNFPLDFSIPYTILSNSIVYAKTNVPDPDNYTKLDDGSGNKYTKYIYITNDEFYTNKEIKLKIWISKDVNFINIDNDTNLSVYYKDWTAESFNINLSNNTVSRNSIDNDKIWTDKMVTIGLIGDNSLLYSIKNKNFVISTDSWYKTISWLNNVNFSDIESLNINGGLNNDKTDVDNRIEVVINWIKYATRYGDLYTFEKMDNNKTFWSFYNVSYNKDNKNITYDIFNLNNNYKWTFKFNINTIYSSDKCGKFDYITNTWNFTDVVYDWCIYRLSNYTSGNIIDNTMLSFYKDFFGKLKYIENLNNKVSAVVTNSPFVKVKWSWTKIWLKDYKKTGYAYSQDPKWNINVEYTKNNWLKFSKKNSTNEYETLWYKTPYMTILNWLKVSYDVQFNNGAEWGGITIWNINIDVNPSRVWFRWPEKYTDRLKPWKKYHVDITYSLTKTDPLTYNAKIYVDGKLVNSLDYINPDLETDFVNQWVGIRSNYYKGDVEYTNLNFSYIKYAKDKKVYDLLNLKEYFKYRTQLNNIDDANKYVTKLLTAYKKAYLLSNWINIWALSLKHKLLANNLSNIMNSNKYYETAISNIKSNIDKTKWAIKSLKLSMFKDLPIVFDNLVYSFSEKSSINFSKKLSSTFFVNQEINNTNQKIFSKKQNGLIKKEAWYKDEVVNDDYRIERANNAISYIMNTANIVKFLAWIDTNSDNPSLKINWKTIDLKTLLKEITKDSNDIYSQSFNKDWSVKWISYYFNSDYDINKFLIPNSMSDFTTTKTVKNSDGWESTITAIDKKYFDLYGLTTGLSKSSNNDVFIIAKLYKLLAKYTEQDIIDVIKNHSKIIIKKYVYDNKNVAKNGPVKMSDFIANFYNKDKSNLYKDDNNDGKNDYVLEDVLLDFYSKLSDNTPNMMQDINVDLWNNPRNALNLFSLLSFKKYLSDNNLVYKDYFDSWNSFTHYLTNSSDPNVIDFYNNYKKAYNNVLKDNNPIDYKHTIDKDNKLISYINLLIKSKANTLPFIGPDWNRISKSLAELSIMSDQNLDNLTLNKNKFYTLNNINWDFFNKNYIPYYKKNNLSTKIELINSYNNKSKELNNLNNELTKTKTAYSKSLQDKADLFSFIIDNPNTNIDTLLQKLDDWFKKQIDNTLQSYHNAKLLSDAAYTNIKNFGALSYLIDPTKYKPSALTYVDSSIFNDEMTQYWVNSKIIENISAKNISQYSKYDIPLSKRFNEYYWVLKIILETKKQLLVGDKHYNNVIDSINKIDTYKNSKSTEDLNSYITYLKDNVTKLYKNSITTLYNTIKAVEYNNQDFDFKLTNYIKNISWINMQIDNPNLVVNLNDSIWENSNIEEDPTAHKSINDIYQSLMNLINKKTNWVDPYINYNKSSLWLDNIESQITDFKGKYNNALTYDWINKEYKTLKNSINNIDLSNISLDVSALKKKKDNLTNDLSDIYKSKIANTKNNISTFFGKYLNAKSYSLYSAKNKKSLDDAFVDFLTDLWKIASKSSTANIYNNITDKISEITWKSESEVKKWLSPDICIINDKEQWNGLKTWMGVCWNMTDNNFIREIYTKALNIYKQQKQYMSNNVYAGYFKQLLSIDPKALDKIFDWDKITLKQNPDIEIIGTDKGLSSSGVFKTSNCSFIIYKKTVWLWIVCNEDIKKIDEPVDNNNDIFNNIVLNFRNTLWRNIYYSLINHYNTLQQINNKYKSHYKSEFLILKSKTGKVFYLKSYYIPNGVSSISIKNGSNVYMNKRFKTPFLTNSWVNEIISSIDNDLDLLSRNGKKVNDMNEGSLIFNDKLLTAFSSNNVWYIINKINMVKNLVDNAVIDSLYKKLSNLLVKKLWFEWMDTKEKIIAANKEKENLFNDLNMINNITFHTYEGNKALITQSLSTVKYFPDAKKYLADLLQSKINSFEEMKNSLLFQQKINDITKSISKFDNHISDNNLDWINKLKSETLQQIQNNFGNKDIINSLTSKLESKYTEVKTAIENNIKYSTSYIGTNSELQGKTEANNILTNSFDSNFVEQLSFNNLLKDQWIIKIKNNQYIVDNSKLAQINSKINNVVTNSQQINIKKIANTNSLKEVVNASDILSSGNKDDVKKKLIWFIYIALKNWEYNVPIDVTEVKDNDSGFFGWVNPGSWAKQVIKSIQYNSIFGEIKDSAWDVIWNKNVEGDINLFLPKDDVELQLNKWRKYLTIVRNLSNNPTNASFFEKDWTNLAPIYMNNFIVSDVAKIDKNFDNNVYGLKTQTLDVTR